MSVRMRDSIGAPQSENVSELKQLRAKLIREHKDTLLEDQDLQLQIAHLTARIRRASSKQGPGLHVRRGPKKGRFLEMTATGKNPFTGRFQAK
jgi:hypothetical protein